MNTDFDPEGVSSGLDPLRRASCHALLCGALSAGASPGQAAQSAAAFEPGLDSFHLKPWARSVKSRLEATDFSFRLGVPGDDTALDTRVAALAAWAREFLSALGRAGERLNTLESEARETLNELDAIGQGATVGEADDESEERMYAELVEHVRLSVLFLYEVLNPPKSSVAQ